MRNVKMVFYISLMSLIFLSQSTHAQKPVDDYSSSYTISVEYPIFYRPQWESYKNGSLYQISFEKDWQSSKYKRVNYSINLNYGLYSHKGFNPIASRYHEHLYGIGFSTLVGSRLHFYEFGIGTNSIALWHAIIGYRMYLGGHFIFKANIMPSTYIVADFLNGNLGEISNYIDLGIGLGYQFSQKDSKTISNFFGSTWNRLSLQSSVYPFSYEEMGLISPSLVFDLGVSLFTHRNSRLGVYGGFGINTEDILFQTGISYLYGKGNHFVEANFNLIFIEISKFNDEYSWYDDYRLLQPQLGYRYQCQKIPMFARIAYAPYIRTLDWKREGGLHHNMVLGLGYRFGK